MQGTHIGAGTVVDKAIIAENVTDRGKCEVGFGDMHPAPMIQGISV